MKKRIAATLMLIVASCCMAGCNNELTEEEVTKSSYYQELLGKYQKKQDRIADLKEQLKNEKSQNQGSSEKVIL